MKPTIDYANQQHLKKSGSPFLSRLALWALLFGLVTCASAGAGSVNLVEASVVPDWLVGTPLHFFLIGAAFPGIVLAMVVLAAIGFPSYVLAVCIGQVLFYWPLGALIEIVRRRVVASRR